MSLHNIFPVYCIGITLHLAQSQDLSKFALNEESLQLCPHDVKTIFLPHDINQSDHGLLQIVEMSLNAWNKEDTMLVTTGYCSESSNGLSLISKDPEFSTELAKSLMNPKCCSFLSDGENTKKLLEKVKPPYNSKVFLFGSNVTREFYTIGESEIYSKVVAEDHQNIWHRRRDLKGLNFNVGIVDHPPFVIFPHDENAPLNESTGYFMETFLHLGRLMNFSFSFYTEIKGGSMSPNGSWNGVIGMLQRKEVELVANGVT